ncbi:MAG TPA: OB-fold domain-containing protein [Rhodoblastus sp.]|nr:OB-fold domain-containing protein [Rhodoblastus sp.]
MGSNISKLVFASTSAPFFERAHAPLLVDALTLDPSVRSFDVAGSRRCALSALLDALLGSGDALIAAGEKRSAQAGNPLHLAFGDGGAAVRVSDRGGARLIGHASRTADFVDLYASREHPYAYGYEERFVREVLVARIVAPTIKAALANAGATPDRVAFAAVHEPVAGAWRDIAKQTGIGAPNLAADLAAGAGDLGAAHALYAAALAFERAAVGDLVLVAGFGSGCDALVFEKTGALSGVREAAQHLREGVATDDYVRFLSLTEALDLDWGVRAEFEQKAQATVLARYGRDMMGFVGGRDSAGNVQFPKSNIPVRPDATGPEKLADVRLADEPARIVSATADRLNFTPDPPFWFGLVQFDCGARIMMEFTDDSDGGFSVGDPVRMRFRIKSRNRQLGFRTYFWKAAPLARPAMGA